MIFNQTLKRVLILSAISVGVLFVLFSVFYVWPHRVGISHYFQKLVQTNEYKVDLPGKIYLSLTPDNFSSPSGIYAYTLASGSLNRVLADVSVKLPSYYINTSPMLSSDGTRLTFVRRSNTELVQQIYTALPDGTNLGKVTVTSGNLKSEPVLSPSNNLVAFTVASSIAENVSESGEIPNNSRVFLSDMSGNLTEVGMGINPLFSPDGTKLLVLQNDGFHLFSISDSQKPEHMRLVLRVSTSSEYQWAKANLSQDGSRIVWAVPGIKQVFIAKINSWNTFSVTPEKTINIFAYQAVFSPSGEQLALEELRPTENKVSTHVVISIYDLSSGKLSDAINLSKYLNRAIRLGGWAL